jgi:hypothetical protein
MLHFYPKDSRSMFFWLHGGVTQKTKIWIFYGLAAGKHYGKIMSVLLHILSPKLLNRFLCNMVFQVCITNCQMNFILAYMCPEYHTPRPQLKKKNCRATVWILYHVPTVRYTNEEHN